MTKCTKNNWSKSKKAEFREYCYTLKGTKNQAAARAIATLTAQLNLFESKDIIIHVKFEILRQLIVEAFSSQ